MKKIMNRSSSVCSYLEKIFRQLNDDKFGGWLETPVITVQDTPHAYGHVSCSRIWKNRQGEKYLELNIGAGTLDRPIANVVATMLHEMVHIYNMERGIKDCSRGGTYHNKKFKSKAEEVGLIIEYDSRIGWSVTSPSEELISYVKSQEWIDIPLSRREKDGGIPGTAAPGMKKPSSTRKYQCPLCKMSVRATKEVNIKCGDCHATLILCQ